ncbi:MAG: hypothetical protein DWQ09_15225 [Proteobacteria bacterium]|nr:MAG: hypothetical protein DWQ09_15225 [Pseudomonadota bacterium]
MDLFPIFIQVLTDQVDQLIVQVVSLHQMLELEYGGFIRNRPLSEIDANKKECGVRVVQGFLGRPIGKTERVREMDA